jgi:hypothetical protein
LIPGRCFRAVDLLYFLSVGADQNHLCESEPQ